MAMRFGLCSAVIAIVALVSVANVAMADDAGVHEFLMNAFGQAGQSAQTAAPIAPPAESGVPRRHVANDRSPVFRTHSVRYRPLTVRRAQPQFAVAAGPSMPVKVSIYRDPTLRAGDAVMTAEGIRIFAGSRSWPYAKSDFVAIAQAHDLTRDTVKILADLNKAPTI